MKNIFKDGKFFYVKKENIYALITVILWGTLAPVNKITLNSLNGMSLVFYNCLTASIVLLIINLKRKGIYFLSEYETKDYLRIASLGILGVFMYYVFYYIGLDHLNSQIASIVNNVWPTLIVIFSCLFLKEKMTSRKIVSLLLTLVGIIIISLKDGISGFTNEMFIGILASFMAAVVYAIYSVFNKKYAYDQYAVQFINFFVTAICALLYCLFTKSLGHLTGSSILAVIWNGAICNGLAYLLWGIALNKGDTAKISLMAYLSPLFTMLFSYILLKEEISIITIIGLVFIIGGIVVQNKAK